MPQKVLIVDDEFLIRWAVSNALSNEGYETRDAEDGVKALEAMAVEDFDFVITDLRMPGLGGWEVLQRAREMESKPKVIVITAHGSADTEMMARERGAYGYVEKPEILDRIRDLLESATVRDAVA